MPDPNVRYRLDEAINMKGVCEDMCPEFERHEREAKGLIDPWEYVCPILCFTYYVSLLLISLFE